jgi:hypothetical protein
MWNCGSSLFSSIDPDPESGFAINLEVEATFDSDPDPRIHTAGFRIQILLLFSSVTFKMQQNVGFTVPPKFFFTLFLQRYVHLHQFKKKLLRKTKL